MNIRDAIKTKTAAVRYSDSVAKAAQLMQETDCCFLPVLNGNRVVGVVTDRDIAVGLAIRQIGTAAEIGNLMSSRVHSIDADASLEEAANEIVAKGVHRLVVVDKFGVFVGVLAISDLEGRISDSRLVHTLRMLADYNHPHLAHRRHRPSSIPTYA